MTDLHYSSDVNSMPICVALQQDNDKHYVQAAAAAASGCQSDDVREVTRRRLSCHAFMDNVRLLICL